MIDKPETSNQPQEQKRQNTYRKTNHKNEVGLSQQFVLAMEHFGLVVNINDHMLIHLLGRVNQLFHLPHIFLSGDRPDIPKKQQTLLLLSHCPGFFTTQQPGLG